MKHFKFYAKEDILSLTKIRRFETKIGERIQFSKPNLDVAAAIRSSSAAFVLIGIPEDIGVNANNGLGGADTNWESFLTAFLNMQSNDFLQGNEMLLLGRFDFGDIKYLIETTAYNSEERLEAYRRAVIIIDEAVEQLIKAIVAEGKTPLVIGGGHNNAYPIIKAVSKGLFKSGKTILSQINVINLDAHSDYRPMEGRHSGNGFRYASEDGYLGKYAIVGLHESYTPQNVLMDIHEDPFIDYVTYEDIFLRERLNFTQAVSQAAAFTEDTYTGIELDLDCIENVLSSAVTPSGVQVLHARQYVSFLAQYSKVAYLHICEGATQLADGRKDATTGKLIAYLVTDFIKHASQIS